MTAPVEDLATIVITDPERLVLQRLADGRTNQQIATEYQVSTGTVAMRLLRLKTRLGIPNATTTHLVVMCLRAGVIR